ncbi:hypothetical protein [Dactylosporangium sp. CA-092794]|uniref:hypothetical protein n=1 Tax=Dactylosporangium sp. CA-092794 TaxID=3239929 RepID=UPI003D8E2F92
MIPHARALLALLPVATLVFAAVALRPRDAPDRRLAVVRAAVAVAVGTVLSVELFSLVDWIAPGPVIALWAVAAAVTGWLAFRGRPKAWAIGWRAAWGAGARGERWAVGALAVVVGLLVAAELVLAVASAPNNFDSNSYHLPKIEHWIADRNLANFPTAQAQELILVPGAEFLLLQLRLLSGSDGQLNLLQWAAGLLGAIAVARCAAQLGAGRVGQWLAATVFLTAPAVVLESTSTQNDLVVTAWILCAATIALDGRRRPATLADVLTLAGAAGLVVVTKSTGLMALVPIVGYWTVCQARQRKFRPMVYGGCAVVAACALLAGPSLLRVQEAFGSPFGPPGYRASLSTTRHDPPAILVNSLRLGASTLLTPIPEVNAAIGGAVIQVARLVGVDPNDPAITQWRSVFPGDRWKPDEDRSPYPVQSALALVATAAGLCLRRTRGYALLILGALLLTAAIVKWQDWGNRLILPAFAVATPLVGVYLETALIRGKARFIRRGVASAAGQRETEEVAENPEAGGAAKGRAGGVARGAAGAVVALAIAAGAAHGYTAVFYGQPRRLVGPWSVFTLDDWQERFVRMPDQAAGYRTAIDRVRAGGAERVGLVLEGDLWEYPLQIELRDKKIVELWSDVPSQPAGDVRSVDAVICVSEQDRCRAIVPQDWRYDRIDPFVTVAFPPR